MPIRPENRARYPKDWPQISLSIRRDRAKWVCEGSPAYPDCVARHGLPHPRTGSSVVLTVAHLDQTPENCDPSNLKAWCQLCHLTYDRPVHITNYRRTMRARKALGDLFEGMSA